MPLLLSISLNFILTKTTVYTHFILIINFLINFGITEICTVEQLSRVMVLVIEEIHNPD